jgi:hypothetical protein
MDILNFISWIASKRRIVTSAPDDALVPIGIRTETRDDKYTTVGITASNFANQVGGLQTVSVDNVTITGNGTPANPLVAIASGEYTYEIGEYVPAQGGVIFHRYKDGGQENYLVVDTTNLSTSSAWSNITSTAIGSSAQSTWDGLSNSNAIVGQAGFINGAAKLCLDLVLLGKNDWYLPAIDELSLLWQNRFNVNRTLSGNSSFGSILGATEIGSNVYWSSTEFNNAIAFNFSFALGQTAFQPFPNKSSVLYVRAVRKFSI